MQTYLESQNRTFARLSTLEHEAKETKRDANRLSIGNDPVDYGRIREAAAAAAESFADDSVEMLAHEVGKSYGTELALDVKQGLDQVSSALEKHVYGGLLFADQRMVLLQRALPHAKAHRDDTLDFPISPKNLTGPRSKAQSGRTIDDPSRGQVQGRPRAGDRLEGFARGSGSVIPTVDRSYTLRSGDRRGSSFIAFHECCRERSAGACSQHG